MPVGGQVVDIYKNVLVIYGLNNGPDVSSLQLSGATSTGISELFIQSGYGLAAGNLLLGPSFTSNSGGGPGEVVQTGGTVTMDTGSNVSVDGISTYALSGTGFLNAYNETVAGFFTDNGGHNTLASGASLTNTGSYSIYNSGVLGADTIVNSGTFNQSTASSLGGTSTANVSFSNTGTYLYTGGNIHRLHDQQRRWIDQHLHGWDSLRAGGG